MVKEHEISEEMLNLFKQVAKDYCGKFGLTDWDVRISHLKRNTGDMATLTYAHAARAANIDIDIAYDVDEDEVRTSALHEVLHLVLTDMREAYSQYLDADVVEREHERFESVEHAAINRIINAFKDGRNDK